ncbi:MAG: acyl-CoA dehydrogenase family protein, partial [Thermodesulfobacteriota bacterium]
MNYELSEAHKALQAEMGMFCREEIGPGAALLDEAPWEEAATRMRVNLKKLARAGYLNLALGDDLLGQCIAGEELARACPSTFLTAMSSATAVGRTIRRFGTKAQQERYIPGLAAGEAVGAFACTEAEAGSDLGGMTTTAEKGDGRRVLNGEKDLVTNAPFADLFLILAWTDQNAGLEGGMTLFLVDRYSEGVTIGKPLETMGLRGALTAGIRLENCAVGEEAVLGSVTCAGYGQLRRIMEEVNLALSAMCVGIGMACMEESTRHGKAKNAFGKSIGLFEGVGAKLAVMFTLNDIGRMMACR